MKRTKSFDEVMNPQRILTLSNIISTLRAILAIPIIVMLDEQRMGWVTVLVVAVVVSDAIDGMLARRFREVTALGKLIDPLADKICAVSVILYLIVKGRMNLNFLIFLMVRDAILAMMQIYLINIKSVNAGANLTGKISICTVAVVIIAHIYDLAFLIAPATAVAYLFLTVSLLQYALFFIRNFGQRR